MFNSVLLLSLTAFQALHAECTLNGQNIPCDQMPPFFFPIIIGVSIFALAGFVFWVMMVIDCIKHCEDNQVLWVLLLTFTGFVGAIVYYFVIKKDKKYKKDVPVISQQDVGK